MKITERSPKKIMLVAGVNILIALLHFVTGPQYKGPLPGFVNGYLLDILIPLGFYLLLCLQKPELFNHWPVKAIPIFAAATAVEITQYFGMPILGQTFDPVDIVMYGVGVAIAVVLDTVILPRMVAFWEAQPVGAQI
jgi:hypothetical protein